MDLDLRQSDVADRIGVWTSTVNYWENNHFNPEVRYLPAIIAFLEYDPSGPQPASLPLQLRAARIAIGLTRRQLAALLEVHPATVAKWERGGAPLKGISRSIGELHCSEGVVGLAYAWHMPVDDREGST